MKRNSFLLVLILIHICSLVTAAKEKKLRSIPMTTNDVMLSSGISCIEIESQIRCYGVNANRSVIHFINKETNDENKWSLWNMLVLEDPNYDVKLDGISCVLRKTLPKCYLRMTNLGLENLIEINPSKKNWYQLCDHLAIKPFTFITEENNVNIISRTIKNEFYHKYVDGRWNMNKTLPDINGFILIGEASCVSIDDKGEIICFYRTDNSNRLVIWSRKDNSFKLIDNEIEFSSDLSCLSITEDQQVKIICFVVNQDENIYGMLCNYKLICSKWLLINSKLNSFKKSKPIAFIYPSTNNKYENIGIYALTNEGIPLITTCQQCIQSIQDWANWMELTSVPLFNIELYFKQEQKIYIIALNQQLELMFSMFDYENHIPLPFNKLNYII